MDRRRFLSYGVLGAATCVAAPSLIVPSAHAATLTYDLSIEPVDVEMIDGKQVYMLLFYGDRGTSSGTGSSLVPRPVLRATEGDLVTIRVTNNAPEPHRFQIPGVGASSMSQIQPGQSRQVTFTAPVGGSYLYLDPLNAPVNRLLGLHGAFIVAPRNGLTAQGKPTPFSAAMHNPAITSLFNAFGASARFPGDTWRPDDPEREKLWVFSQTDPALNKLAERRQTINAASVTSSFMPSYFTINGLSGFDLDEQDEVCPKGYVGQPTLIRTLNAGLVTHSPHIHGNHIFELSGNSGSGAVIVRDNLFERDVWTLAPLQRKDVLLPFEKPPDIPAAVWPPSEEPFPMRFVMHCHTEMSQTAGGGNYPQGLVTHFEITGPLRSA